MYRVYTLTQTIKHIFLYLFCYVLYFYVVFLNQTFLNWDQKNLQLRLSVFYRGYANKISFLEVLHVMNTNSLNLYELIFELVYENLHRTECTKTHL